MGEIFKLFGTIGIDNKEANDGIDETTGKGEQSANKLTGFFKKAAGAIAAAFAAGKLIDFGKMAVEAAASAQAINAQFEQVFGDMGSKAQESINSMADEFGMVPNRLKPGMTKMTSMFKGLGLDTEDAMNKASTAVRLSADAAAFYDTSFEEANGSLTSFLKGNYEAGESIGIFANDTQMAAFAISNGLIPATEGAKEATEKQLIAVEKAGQSYKEATAKYGEGSLEAREAALKLQDAQDDIDASLGPQTQKWADLDEATKQATRLEYAQNMQELAGATGQASRESDGYENQMGNVKQAWQDFLAIVGTPILGTVVEALKGITGGLQTMGEALQGAPAFISGFVDDLMKLQGAAPYITIAATAIGVLAVALNAGAIAQGIYTAATTLATAATTAFTAVMAVLTSPITLVVAAIAALVAIGVALYQNWETVGPFLAGVWQTISDTAVAIWGAVAEFFVGLWEGIKTTFMAVWTPISEFLTTTWDAIKLGAETVFNAIAAFFSTIWEGIKTVFTVVVTVIAVIIGTAIELWKNTIGAGMKFIWDKIKAVWDAIAGFLGPIVAKIGEVISSAWNAIKNVTSTVFNAIKGVITTVWNAISTAISTVVNTVKNVISTAWNAIKSVTSTVFNAIKGVATTVWKGISTAVSTVVNGIKNTISTVFNAVKSTVTTVWNGIKTAIMTPINLAKSAVKGAIDAIKGFFSFKISWPHIPMPHFGIKPKGWGIGDLLKGKIPSLDVDFYAKGGIMNKATAFGANGNSLMVGGEAGKEAILPLNRETLGGIGRGIAGEMEYSQGAVVSKLDELIGAMQDLLGNRNLQVVLDSGELVGGIEDKLNTALGQTKKYDERGR